MYGVRCKVYGVRCTVYGVRCTVYGVRLGWARLTAEVDRERNWISTVDGFALAAYGLHVFIFTSLHDEAVSCKREAISCEP